MPMRSAKLLLRHITAAHFPDAATYRIADLLQADQTLSDWLIPFSSQYPIQAPNSGALSQVWRGNIVLPSNRSIVEHREKRAPYHNCWPSTETQPYLLAY